MKKVSENAMLRQKLILVFPCFYMKTDICYSVKIEPCSIKTNANSDVIFVLVGIC